MSITHADFSSDRSVGRLDSLLRFERRVAARYEAEHAAARVRALRQAILIGLLFYNAYNLTSILLMPDILGLSLALRLLFVTPVSLALAWAVAHVGGRMRESLVLNGIVGAFAVPVLLFWLTEAPFGTFTFGELPLTLIFGTLVLGLRFPHAIAFVALAFAMAAAAVLTKPGLADGLRHAFLVQIGTGCLFALWANHRMETRRGTDYLAALRARLETEAAEAARRQFQDLSVTDALTGLPNRRALDLRLEAWFADARPAAVMMIDIDHFKLFNDTLGHPAGDDCLRSVAAAFTALGAGTDTLFARFGGEEFTCALQDVGALEAARLAAGLVRAVEALGIVHPGRSDGPGIVTVSVGVALKPAGVGATRHAVLDAADRALYRAKSRGRNGYVLDDSGMRGVALVR